MSYIGVKGFLVFMIGDLGYGFRVFLGVLGIVVIFKIRIEF